MIDVDHLIDQLTGTNDQSERELDELLRTLINARDWREAREVLRDSLEAAVRDAVKQCAEPVANTAWAASWSQCCKWSAERVENDWLAGAGETAADASKWFAERLNGNADDAGECGEKLEVEL